MNCPDWSARRDAGAIQFMLLDIIANLLTFTDNPKEMGAYFTRQIREIVGAKKVILVQAPVTQKGVHRIVSVEPKREWDAIPSSELDCLAHCCRANEGSAFWIRGEACQEVNEALARMGVGSVIATPLKVGKEWAGALFVVDLIEFSRTADNTDVLDVLSPVVALVLRNAGFFEAQEEVIEERTKALSQSERSFHSLAKVAPVGIFRLDAEGNFLYANDRMREITGATGSIPDTEHWTQILRPEDRPGVEAGLGRTLSTGENFRQEFRLLMPSGEWATVIGEAVSECDENGVITGFIGTLTDITERKKTEEMAHRANVLLQQTFEQSPVPMVLVSMPDAVLRIVNSACLRFLGIEDEPSRVDTPLLELQPSWHDLDQQGQLTRPEDLPLARSLQGTWTEGEERCIVRKDGTIRHELVNAAPIQDEAGHIIAGFLTLTDITAHRLAVDALRQSEALFRTLAALAPVGIYLTDPQGNCLYANPAWCSMAGLSLEEALGQGWTKGLHPDDRELVFARWNEMVEAQGQWGMEYRFLTREGRVTVVYGLAASEYDPSGNLIGYVGVNLDITERKRTEDVLRRREAMLSRTEGIAHIGSWEWEVATDTVTWSDELFRILQRNPTDGALSFAEHDRIYHPEDILQLRRVVEIALREGTPYEVELRATLPDGHTGTFIARGHAETSPSGKISRLFGTLQDITYLKQAEEERRRLDARMSQIQKLEALGVLVAGVAHNINNVLAAIMGMASVRERQTTEAKDLEAYAIIGTACKRGRDVVKSLVQFAQPTLSNQRPCELHSLIKELRILLEATTRNRIEIREALAGEPLWVHGDAGSLSHALMNLCLNSMDAMPDAGTLTFRTTMMDSDWAEVCIEDSGEGMSPEILARVTEPFFTTKEVGKGTGLGLSMTHGVIKAHGGTLEIASAPGHGTIVKLRLPRIPAPVLDQPIAGPTPILRPLNVLLVDDDEDVRYLVSRMLKMAGLQIKSVASGEEALESLGSGALPDLIILDQNMPRMSGIQTMERIRVLHPDVLILISSGQPDIEDWPCFKQPNVAVISKPFELEELMAKLAHLSPNP